MKEHDRGKECGTNEEKRETYIVLVEKTEGRGPLGTPRRRWKNSIKIVLLEILSEILTVINLAQDTPKWLAVEHGDESSGSMKCQDIFD